MLPFDKEYDKKYDAVLADLICKGSAEALKIFLSVHQQFVYNVALRMLNSQLDATKLTKGFMLKLLLNIRTAKDSEDITLWIYRRLVEDIRKALNDENFCAGDQFEELADLIGHESQHPQMSATLKEQFKLEIEAITNTCLTNMAACLPVQQRFAFVFGGVFNIPVSAIAGILQMPIEEAGNLLSTAKDELMKFIGHNCSVLGHDNTCTCDKRTNHYLAQDNPISFFNDFDEIKRKRISDLLEDNQATEDITNDELIKLYRNQPFINTNSTNEGVGMLCKKPDVGNKNQILN